MRSRARAICSCCGEEHPIIRSWDRQEYVLCCADGVGAFRVYSFKEVER